jgi:hypothetical protein
MEADDNTVRLYEGERGVLPLNLGIEDLCVPGGGGTDVRDEQNDGFDVLQHAAEVVPGGVT